MATSLLGRGQADRTHGDIHPHKAIEFGRKTGARKYGSFLTLPPKVSNERKKVRFQASIAVVLSL